LPKGTGAARLPPVGAGGVDALPAGGIAREIGVLPNTLFTHLTILGHAGWFVRAAKISPSSTPLTTTECAAFQAQESSSGSRPSQAFARCHKPLSSGGA